MLLTSLWLSAVDGGKVINTIIGRVLVLSAGNVDLMVLSKLPLLTELKSAAVIQVREFYTYL